MSQPTSIRIDVTPDQAKLISQALRLAADQGKLPAGAFWAESPEVEAVEMADTLDAFLADPIADVVLSLFE